MAKKQNEVDKLSFEQAIEALTGIVDKIETGQVPLAEGLVQYEKGMALIKHCRAILLDAEKRIENITIDDDQSGEELEENDDEEDNDKSDEDEKDESLF